MKKYWVRIECLVEYAIEAENIEQANERAFEMDCDALNTLNKNILEVYDTVEIEER